MKITNLTDDEQRRLLELALMVAAGNTEFSDLERDAEELIQGMERARQEIADALRAFSAAGARLAFVWEKHPEKARGLSYKFPFPDSFDEAAYNITAWASHHIHELDPDPEGESEPIASQATDLRS